MKPLLMLLGPDSVGAEKRLYEMVMHQMSVSAHYQGTWCELFKTKGYLRADEHMKKVRKHLARLVLRVQPTATWYGVDMMGSKRILDVQSKRGQKYLVTFKFD